MSLHRLAAALAALVPLATLGQVRTDASLGRAAASLVGPNYVIPQSLGRLAGANLFHSFQSFGIAGGETATFLTTTPGLANILARVTGGDVSYINGTLSVQAANATPAFWLINPAGVVFGNGASLNVPGAFHVTTANYIRFADGEFHADLAKTSTFSSLAPEAYGFLGNAPGIVSVENGAVVYNSGAIDVVAGSVSVNGAQLATSAGDIRIVALGQRTGEVARQGPVPDAGGPITIALGGLVGSNSGGAVKGGDIGIYAGTLLLDGRGTDQPTGISSVTASSAPSGSIDVQIAGTANIIGGASITTRTEGPGSAGFIHFAGRDLTIEGKGIDGTGILSHAAPDSSGAAGTVDVSVAGALTLFSGGVISSDTQGAGNAGTVRVEADTILLDGRNSEAFTGISSDTVDETSSGSAGTLEVRARGMLTLLGGSEISSTSNGTGNAGNIFVHAGELLIDGGTAPDFITGIHSSAFGNTTGNGGNVEVRVDATARIAGTGEISADTYTSGPAGNVLVVARDLIIDGGGLGGFTGISSDAIDGSGRAGNVEVHASTLRLLQGGSIASDTETAGRAGNVLVVAGDLVIDGGGFVGFTGISSDALDGSGHAGNVEVRASTARLLQGGEIASDTFTAGDAGSVLVVAGSLMLDGYVPGFVSGISSRTNGGPGAAGQIQVQVDGLLSLANGAIISTTTRTSGDGGRISVSAGSLSVDGNDLPRVTGISSQSEPGSTGNAGTVVIDVQHDATIRRTATISSGTFSTGAAGSVRVHVGGNLSIEGSTGRFLTGIETNSITRNAGPAGDVDVTVGGLLALVHDGVIESDTSSLSNAGRVHVSAGSLRIDGAGSTFFTGISSDSRTDSGGRAGDVTVEVANDALMVRGGSVASTTRSTGDAGTVTVRAGNLVIDGTDATFTGISTSSVGPRTGDAGRIAVTVDGDLQLRNGGAVASATSSDTGRAGTIEIETGRLLVDGAFGGNASSVSARSDAGASGQTGSISITASESITVSNGGRVTIDNGSTVADPSTVLPSQLSLRAPTIVVDSGGIVTAQSSGNVSASNIRIDAPGQLWLDSGSITTSANLGNGGGIAIDAGTVRLTNSLITTSVLGSRGDGGDIDVHADVLRLETGFIQANTAANDASGGNVAIDVGTMVATGSNVFVGGSTPIAFAPGVFALNVIQAAAPTGVSGAINITSPVLDTAGALAGLGVAPLDTSLLGRSPCRAGAGSSLALAGRGGLAPGAREAFRIDPRIAAAPTPRRPWEVALADGPCASPHAAL